MYFPGPRPLYRAAYSLALLTQYSPHTKHTVVSHLSRGSRWASQCTGANAALGPGPGVCGHCGVLYEPDNDSRNCTGGSGKLSAPRQSPVRMQASIGPPFCVTFVNGHSACLIHQSGRPLLVPRGRSLKGQRDAPDSKKAGCIDNSQRWKLEIELENWLFLTRCPNVTGFIAPTEVGI